MSPEPNPPSRRPGSRPSHPRFAGVVVVIGIVVLLVLLAALSTFSGG